MGWRTSFPGTLRFGWGRGIKVGGIFLFWRRQGMDGALMHSVAFMKEAVFIFMYEKSMGIANMGYLLS